MTTQAPSPADLVKAWAETHGVTMVATFVPYSVAKAARKDWSETASGPWVGMTWKISLQRNGREFLATDYSAGIGHCPGYKVSESELNRSTRPARIAKQILCEWECEHGKAGRFSEIMGGSAGVVPKTGAKPLLPALEDVLSSISMDASALDEASFEDWADSLGYDRDSRRAEGIYKACMEIATRLRAAVGEAGLEALRTACQDY
jgi:hypothetical protein